MVKLNHLLVAYAVIGAGSVGFAWGQIAGGLKSSDPFVERRVEKDETKREYNAGDMSKEEYQKQRADEDARLKASGERGVF